MLADQRENIAMPVAIFDGEILRDGVEVIAADLGIRAFFEQAPHSGKVTRNCRINQLTV
jgi:hypothetical protein